MVTQYCALNMLKVEAQSFDRHIDGKSLSYETA